MDPLSSYLPEQNCDLGYASETISVCTFVIVCGTATAVTDLSTLSMYSSYCFYLCSVLFCDVLYLRFLLCSSEWTGGPTCRSTSMKSEAHPLTILGLSPTNMIDGAPSTRHFLAINYFSVVLPWECVANTGQLLYVVVAYWLHGLHR